MSYCYVSCLQVALVYHVDDPINFMTSFYGCLIAGIIPVPIEPPASKDVSSFLWLPTVLSTVILFICFICYCCWKSYTVLLMSCILPIFSSCDFNWILTNCWLRSNYKILGVICIASHSGVCRT